MSDTPKIGLDLLEALVQRVLDGQHMLRDDNRNMRRRLSRIEHRLSAIEHAMLALQSEAVDRAEDDTAAQDQLDALTARVERLESGPQ